MSLKTIELQVALPRTFDAGRLQEQAAQKSNVDQHQNAMQSQSEQELNRTKSAPIISTNESLAIYENPERSKPPKKDRENKEKKDEEQHHAEAQHPYKGKHVDLSL